MSEVKKVLLVEDDATLRRSLEEYLKQSGFAIEIASDGEEALNNVNKYKPDVVLLDLVLPKMDGISFLKELRKDDSHVNLPVMILTNTDDIDSIGQSLDVGVTDYLIKHEWRLEDIVKKIKQRLAMPE